MALHIPNNFMLTPCKCHVCYKDIDEQQHAIEHTGHGQMGGRNTILEGLVSVWMHPACATIVALRLAHDVMKIKNMPDQPRRIVDELQTLAKPNQLQGVNHGSS